jgi:hypothetical protein
MRFIIHQSGNDLVSEEVSLFDSRLIHLEEALQENDILGFAVEDAPPNTDFRLTIGDVKVSDPRFYRQSVEWEGSQYLANTFGKIQLILHACERSTEAWRKLLLVEFFCYPSKLTLMQFKRMLGDISEVCKGLLLDVVSKARSSFGWIAARSVEELSGIEEHIIIDQLLQRFEPILERISSDPAVGLSASNIQSLCYGHENFSARSLVQMTRSGLDPRQKGSRRPFVCEIQKKELTFDTWENRQILSFCRWVATRASLVAGKAQMQMDAIIREKQWRKRAPKGVISLWDLEDAPRIAKLERSVESCRRMQRRISLYPQRFSFLTGLWQNNLDLRPTPKFLQDLFYAHAYSAMIEFVSTRGVMFDKGILEQKLKETSKLYEYWSFILLFFYLKDRLGLPTDNSERLLRPQGGRDTYVLTLGSGDSIVFPAPNGLRIMIHYEPTFFIKAESARLGSRFFRSSLKGMAPLVPDIYIELLSGPLKTPRLEYGIVIDCKYSPRILESHWADVEKYQSELFESVGNRNVADQLWIIHPGTDPHWEVNVPDRSLDELARMSNAKVQGVLSLTPIKSEDARGSIEQIFDLIDDSIGRVIRSLLG